jgi:gamma-glutamyltranspeptidase/glutathione hydrolase
VDYRSFVSDQAKTIESPTLKMKHSSRFLSLVTTCVVALNSALNCYPADLSPGQWPTADRERFENSEYQSWSPLSMHQISGSGGIVSATVSPVAIHAGVQALELGGNAADAAATTALTQITTQIGSVVSYAGIFTMLYYDAKSQKVYSMDAGYNSYLQETDPKTIPVGDFGPLPVTSAPKPTENGAMGRQTLVPGFMAGVEAMHARFGRLPFSDLFKPAIWYADKGVRISPTLQYFFTTRQRFLARTPEGREFLKQAGSDTPKAGDMFIQHDLASTLAGVAEHGSQYMYTGPWGGEFVRIVDREGGKVSTEDMARYAPIWSEPYKDIVFDHTVYVNGPPHSGAYSLIAGLNLAEALKLDQKGPYWTDPETFQALARITQLVVSAPILGKQASSVLTAKSVDITPDAQLGKTFAGSVAPLLDRIFAPATEDSPKHSNAIVVVDKDGNIAVVTHTINTVIWGDTGIVVGGIPIPDPAGFQQRVLVAMKPGDRVPHQIIDTITFKGDVPVFATASIGSSLLPETLRVLVGTLGQHKDLATLMAAPPLLLTFDLSGVEKLPGQKEISIPLGAYSPEFVGKLKALGINIVEVPVATAGALRGTLAAVAIDPETQTRSAVNQPGVMVFGETQ